MPNFRPDTGGRRWTLIRVASSLALRGGMALLSLLRCSGSRLLYMECALRAPRGSSPLVFHKNAEQKAAPAFRAFPVRAAQAARSLTGALSPGAARLLPSAAPAPVPARTLCLPMTLPVDVDHPDSQEVFD